MLTSHIRRSPLQFSAIFARRMSNSVDTAFKSAKERLNLLKDDPGSEAKLQLYAYFKQATSGPLKAPKPRMTDFVGQAKWKAWDKLRDLSVEDAKQGYIDLVNQLLKAAGQDTTGQTTQEGSSVTQSSSDELIQHVKEGKVFNIVLNRAQKKNALTPDMYNKIREGLEIAAKDTETVVTVLSGRGDYFSSGNDLGNFLGAIEDIPRIARESKVLLQNYVGAYIDHPKPLIALVNGPAIGISVTILGLFDVVYASDKASFVTPFSALGQSPEGCSSYTFPRIMGVTKASEFLLFGKKLSAAEACDVGLVTEIIPESNFQQETAKKIQDYSRLPPQSMRLSRGLIRDSLRAELHRVNEAECTLLEERWQSEECAKAVMNFFSKSKV